MTQVGLRSKQELFQVTKTIEEGIRSIWLTLLTIEPLNCFVENSQKFLRKSARDETFHFALLFALLAAIVMLRLLCLSDMCIPVHISLSYHIPISQYGCQ